MKISKELESKIINTIRFLSADGVQKANSGHPGLPMGTAAIAYTIWTRHMKFNPGDPEWFDRDRFILSGGHGSMLLYSLLYLTGHGLSLEELKNFRQWGSLTPGHPEFGLTPGVETTTGPLGQGFANGVGFAIAESKLANTFNKPDCPVIDHFTYAIVTDGDLMEGISSEAASLAGHLSLGKLIYLYDDNHISIDGSTELSFTEDRAKRFEAYNWHVQNVKDGNDVEAIDKAIQSAKSDPRPSIIMCRTTIGYGLPTKAGTEEAHGAPPGEEELANAKKGLDWPSDENFYIPDDVASFFAELKKSGAVRQENWNKLFNSYKDKHSKLAAELERRITGELPANWTESLQTFPTDEKGVASRNSSGVVLNEIADILPELVGGSADLTPSNKTWIKSSTDYQTDNPSGRYIHFGVREHSMGGIVNGIAYHGGFIPYGGTFLVFSDYMRPSVRLSALSHIGSIWVYTHDSIGVGEDGPTHQPVEHVMSLRLIPNLTTIRPADANEVREAWITAVENRNRPTALILSRQNLPTIDRKKFAVAEGLRKGAYVLADMGESNPELILMATGSEVSLIITAGKKLVEKGHSVRLVSFPSWELFENQSSDYQESVFSPEIKRRVAVEAGVTLGWQKWVGDDGAIIGINRFGASAPGGKLMKEFGFSAENVYQKALELLESGE